MSRSKTLARLAAVAAASAMVALTPATAGAALVEHDGPVLSKESKGKRSFRIEDDESGREFRFRVNAGTKFERIPGGFSGLERGMNVSVDAKKKGDRLVATQVEAPRN